MGDNTAAKQSCFSATVIKALDEVVGGFAITHQHLGPVLLGGAFLFPPSSAPILFRFPLHRRRVRVFHLEPVLRAPGDVARAQPLRHDAFEAHLAGVLEHNIARMRQMLVEPQARQAPSATCGLRRLMSAVGSRTDSTRTSPLGRS